MPFPAEVEHSLRGALQDRYVIEREIGRGGMGVVFSARDLKHDRTVAIKALRPDIATYRGTDRFLTEIRTAARLTHPHIVTVFDSGEVGGVMYYVMPFVEGESLRGLLQRTGKLEPAVAVKIASQIASALQYAHDLGVVHRDIKPENILLADGHAWLADFGVARALAGDGDLNLTATGQLLGSPLYASPEHSGSPGDIDGRTDIYSLGCVLYEMITGSPPFTGKTMQAVLMRHHTEKPGSLTRVRPDIPAALDDVVQTALAKRPEQRFANAAGFEAALSRTIGGTHTVVWRPRIARRAIGLTAALGAIGIVVVVGVPWVRSLISSSIKASAIPNEILVDTMYVILPFVREGEVPNDDFEDRLGDALASWEGIDVVDHGQVKAFLATVADTNPADVARHFRAGRLVSGRLSRTAESLRVYAEIMEGQRPDVKLAKQRPTFALDQVDQTRQFRQLADSLVLPNSAPECRSESPGTNSIPAIRACDRAFSAIEDGQLVRGELAFVEALRADPSYPRAALWLAQLRTWVVRRAPNTSSLVTIALAGSNRLSKREKLLATGLSELQARRFEKACEVYRQVVAADSLDYAAWLGLGECHVRDNIVLTSATSPSGWNFRSSYHRGIQAYRRAFELKPALMSGFKDHSFAALRTLLMTSPTHYREGRDASDQSFMAVASLHGDSLVLFPRPSIDFMRARAGAVDSAYASAADKQRNLFRDIASRWSQVSPKNPDALFALAVARELVGDRSAIDAIRWARNVATSPEDRLLLAAAEVWILLKFNLPDGTAEIRAAFLLADSLLRQTRSPSAEGARSLAALAVLLGRPAHAAELARQTAAPLANRTGLAQGVVEHALALLAFASAGAPIDSIRRLENDINVGLQNTVSGDQLEGARVSLLTQPTMMAMPVYAMKALPFLAQHGAYTEAEFAYSKHDSSAVRNVIQRLADSRWSSRAADVSIDGLYTEAWLLHSIGHSQQAKGRLTEALNALRWFPPAALDDIARSGALIRSMTLLVELAAMMNDADGAKRWSKPVLILWTKPDKSLQSTRQRVQKLAS